MMHQASINLGLETWLLSEAPDSSAAQVMANVVVGDYNDELVLRNFAEQVDFLTFDHEHVPTRYLAALEQVTKVRPGPGALRFAQDKLAMREELSGRGYPCPQFRRCDSPSDLVQAGQELGWPLIAKTSRGGYDGKGVWKLASHTEAGLPFVDKPEISAGEPVRILAEEFVEFERELSALVVRAPSGQAVAYPISETLQADGICVETITPAPNLTDATASQLQEMALQIAGDLDVVGVLAVELMAAKDGRILINELAMRPHNTGHWSIDGAATSQFDNHLRAVANLPLGAPQPSAPHIVMRNVLGGTETDLTAALQHVFARDRNLRVHLYGKDVKPGRKVGHVTATDTDLVAATRRARHAANYLMGKADE